ncbi:unnamed protein product [Alternaria burnsii]|nr:unnamed protein product [Alternaria burnsii]
MQLSPLFASAYAQHLEFHRPSSHIKCCIAALVLLGAFPYVQTGRTRSALLGVTSAARSCACYEKAYTPLIADLRSGYSDPQRTYPRT